MVRAALIRVSVCAARDRGGLKGGQRGRVASAQDPGR